VSLAAISALRIELTHHSGARAEHTTVTGERYEHHLACLPRLETNRGAGWDVETITTRRGTLEGERRVDLEKVIVAPDLYGSVAQVADRQPPWHASGVQLDVAIVTEYFSRDHEVAPRW
jgi:hypothetical protein